jgi:hypothetical protein
MPKIILMRGKKIAAPPQEHRRQVKRTEKLCNCLIVSKKEGEIKMGLIVLQIFKCGAYEKKQSIPRQR